MDKVKERSLVRCLVMNPQEQKVLVLKRSEKERFGAGLWEILQGSREQGETPDEAVYRELEEEIGLGHDFQGLLLPVSTDHFAIGHKMGHTEDWSNVNYVLLLDNELSQTLPLALDEDHDEAKWVTVSEAKALLGEHPYSIGGQKMLDQIALLSSTYQRAAAMLKSFAS